MSNAADHRRQVRLQVMLEADELKAIDMWRFKNLMPSRAAAIRELIRRGMSMTDDPQTLADSSSGRAWPKSSTFGIIRLADAAPNDDDGGRS